LVLVLLFIKEIAMDVYNVGHDELSEWDLEYAKGAVWFVYSYEDGGYDGSGEGVALMPDGQLQCFNLSHCSCYGPMESGIFTSVEEYLRPKDSVHDYYSKPEVEAKVRELLGK
jgi:hypothetical protein